MNEIKELFNHLSERAGQLTPGQLDLVKSMLRYYRCNKRLSERQMATLTEIKKYCDATI